MSKKWIRLFDLCDRSLLEENLNKMISEYGECEIDVWSFNDRWMAKVRYSYSESPQYSKPETSEASSDPLNLEV